MPRKPARTRKQQLRHSRAALATIQFAVDTVADSIHQLRTLRRQMQRGHRAALSTLRMARHHCLSEPDLTRVEDIVGQYARVADWPATMRCRNRHEQLERPLSDLESSVLASLAGSALTVVAGALTIWEQLDAWYGGLAVTAAAAARAALPSVTAATHRRRADKLMLRLELLCANDHIAWAFAAAPPKPPEPTVERTLH